MKIEEGPTQTLVSSHNIATCCKKNNTILHFWIRTNFCYLNFLAIPTYWWPWAGCWTGWWPTPWRPLAFSWHFTSWWPPWWGHDDLDILQGIMFHSCPFSGLSPFFFCSSWIFGAPPGWGRWRPRSISSSAWIWRTMPPASWPPPTVGSFCYLNFLAIPTRYNTKSGIWSRFGAIRYHSRGRPHWYRGRQFRDSRWCQSQDKTWC